MSARAGLRTLYSSEAIAERVDAMGAQITTEYSGTSCLVVLCVLKGAFVFAADLARAIDLPLRVEFLAVQSYGDETESSGDVQITQDLTRPIEGEDVLLVEDIVDTGLTLHFLLDLLRTRRPKSLKVCSLLHKPARKRRDVPIDYLGFTIDDVFVVGYGLDHAQQYRNVPDLCVVEDSGDDTR